MIYKFNNFMTLNESALKNAKEFADKHEDKETSSKVYNDIREMLDKNVKSKYCHKKDNFHLAMLFIKIALSEEVGIFSNYTLRHYQKDDKTMEDYNYDRQIDDILEENDNSLETLMCYILKYDKYLNYLPIKPITAYTEKNVKKYHQSTGGNVNMGVYETINDHIVRYLPIKLQANDWIKKFPSKLKQDYKQNQDESDPILISTFNTYNSLPDDEKKSIFTMYFGTKDENGKISKFNTIAEFLDDFKKKLGANNSIDGIVKQINDFGNGVDIVYNDRNVLVVIISTHKASVEFGKDTTWCISDSSDYQYQSYCGYDKKTAQYFIWDFNKEVSDDMFRLGITVKESGEVRTAHDKSDGYVENIESYFKKDLRIPFKQIIKPLSKRELNVRTKIKKINDEFDNMLSGDNNKLYKKTRTYFIKHKDVINLKDDGKRIFFKRMVTFGDVEMIKYFIEEKTFEFNNNNGLAIALAYRNSEKSFEYLFGIDDSFKLGDDNYRIRSFVNRFFKDIKNKEDFRKIYDRFSEVNEGDENVTLNDDIFSGGFIDKVIENDDVDLLKYYVDEFNYDIPESYSPDNISGSLNILKYVYEYGAKSEDDEEDETPRPNKVAKYLINKGIRDNDANYTISLYKLKPEFDELLNKVVSNGYEDKEDTMEHIFKEKDIEFELGDLIGYEWEYKPRHVNSKGSHNLSYVIHRFFEHKDITAMNRLLSKNINYIYFKTRSNYNEDVNLKYYLEKEKNINNAINLFRKFPSILKDFTTDPNPNYDNSEEKKEIYKDHYKHFYQYSVDNKIIEIFKSTIKYGDKYGGGAMIEYEKSEYPEFVKEIVENNIDIIDDVANLVDVYYNYNHKDMIINVFSNVEYLQNNLDKLLGKDKNREITNSLKNKGILTPKLIEDAGISYGIYVNSFETMHYLFTELGGRASNNAISSYIFYGMSDVKSKTIDESDLKVKNVLELLQNNGGSFKSGTYSEDTGNNVEKLIQSGLYLSTKFAIDSGAPLRLETIGHYSGTDRVVDEVISSNNIKMFNYFKDVLKVEFRAEDYDNMNNITNSRYRPNIKFFDIILDYARSHNLEIKDSDLFMKYLRSKNLELIKHVYNKIDTLNPTYILSSMCGYHSDQNIEVITWLVEEKDADYGEVWDKWKRRKTLEPAARDYFKAKIKEDKLKESVVFSFDNFVNLIK